MNNNFARIITLLRKERGYSQKKAAGDLGISQALLSHYEKGIRECGLDFVVKVADYYKVSSDYLLGRTPQRSGATITVEDLPEPDAAGRENVLHGKSGSMLPVLNKKLLANSLNVVFGMLQKYGCKSLTCEISSYLNLCVYRVFRLLYSGNAKNPQGLFAVPARQSGGRSCAAQEIALSNAACLLSGEKVDDLVPVGKGTAPIFSPEKLSSEYPLFSSSLFNLVQNSENRMGVKRTSK
jgi:transcriptional regulator with XRE-family HTH domain